MTWILLTGRPGAGKTTLAERLADGASFGVVNVGDALAEWLPTGVQRHDVGRLFVESYGLDAIAEAIVARADGRSRLVVDGLRFSATCLALAQRRSTHHWHLEASREVAEARLRRRLDGHGVVGRELDMAVAHYLEYDEESSRLRAAATAIFDAHAPSTSVSQQALSMARGLVDGQSGRVAKRRSLPVHGFPVARLSA